MQLEDYRKIYSEIKHLLACVHLFEGKYSDLWYYLLLLNFVASTTIVHFLIIFTYCSVRICCSTSYSFMCYSQPGSVQRLCANSRCTVLRVFVCVCMCVSMYLHPFTVKASSVWISWNTREQINDAVLKTFLSYVKSFHRYFRMKHQTLLTSHFILFTQQKPPKPRFNQFASRFQSIRP